MLNPKRALNQSVQFLFIWWQEGQVHFYSISFISLCYKEIQLQLQCYLWLPNMTHETEKPPHVAISLKSPMVTSFLRPIFIPFLLLVIVFAKKSKQGFVLQISLYQLRRHKHELRVMSIMSDNQSLGNLGRQQAILLSSTLAKANSSAGRL